jgi:hypothetical protein
MASYHASPASQAKYLNKTVEQDQRRVKQSVRSGMGFGFVMRQDET